MATAVKKELPVVPPPYEVTLTLSQREAEVLALILYHIGGPWTDESQPREVANRIADALLEAGVRRAEDIINPSNSSIYFV